MNLQGIETSIVERGDVLVLPGTLLPTRTLDAYFEYLPSAPRPLRHRARLRFHTGTNLTIASMFLLEREELIPGEGGFVQLRLDRPIVALPQDRFVIRDSSAIQTLGGGVILDSQPFRHKRHSPAVIQDLTQLKEGSGEEVLRQYIHRSGAEGVLLEELLHRVAISSTEVQRHLKRMTDQGKILLIDPERMKVIDIRQYEQLKGSVLSQLGEFHQRFPMKSGLAKEELRTKLPTDIKLFQALLGELVRMGKIVIEKDKLRLPNHQITSTDEKGLVRRAEETFRKADLQPPSSKELSEEWSEEEGGVQAVLDHLVHEGVLVKIKSGMYFHRDGIERLREKLVDYLKSHHEITTPQLKELTGVSRKYTIPLIEYFDQIRLTLRLGDKRVLRSSSQGLS